MTNFSAALVVGARKDYDRQALLPRNAVHVLLGDQALARSRRPRLRLHRHLHPAEADRRGDASARQQHEEALGMDVVQPGEETYVTGEGAILVVPEDGGRVPAPIADPG